MTRLTDENIVFEALQKGEAAAYAQVYNNHFEGLCYFINRNIADRQAAEDIAAESFIKTFDRITQFESMVKLKSFLYTVANNATLDLIKSTNRHRSSHEEINFLQKETYEESIEKQVIRAEVMQAIYSEIENLPKQSREVIRLSLLEGKSIDEVAHELGMAYKTVQHYKTQGLKTLRIQLLKNKIYSLAVIIQAIALIYSLEKN
ncbi:MAG: sigma-70 family RNA polymerase sigma factor [Chitinophagaceae bacterium]|nr:sigma-70 family RNA polymerase sigma factor [Chitinophagaceae bacterium]